MKGGDEQKMNEKKCRETMRKRENKLIAMPGANNET